MDAAFIQTHFIDPIWSHSGYNPINTLTYAAIALGTLYLIWRYFDSKRFELDASFWATALTWTLWGSSIRVVTDAIYAGTMAKIASETCSYWLATTISQTLYPPLLDSHLLNYGLWTVTPGIYIVTASLFLSSYFIGRRLGLLYLSAFIAAIGTLLNLLLLLPMAKYTLFTLAPIVIAAAVVGALHFLLKWRSPYQLLPVFGQALDGAATWVTIDWFGPSMGLAYGEQHVVSNWVGTITPLGFGAFFLLKILFSSAAVHLIHSEEMDARAKSMALLTITILGLAPGLRDLLRVWVGS